MSLQTTYEVVAEFQMDGGSVGEESAAHLSSRPRPRTPPLFDQTRLRKPEYWQCIKLIAPSEDEDRNWKASDALGAWCIVCRKKVRWRLGKSTGIHRHMEMYHQDLLDGVRSSRMRRISPNTEGVGETYFDNKRAVFRPKASKRRSTPPLFNQVRLRRPEYWQCIKLIAPSDERKMWKASDALGSWCTLCDEEVTWTLGNIQGVKRHMMAYHRELLDIKKENETDEIEDYPFVIETLPFHQGEQGEEGGKEGKEILRSMNKDHQKIGEAVLIRWIAETLQSFDIVESNAFQDLVQFLCNFKGEFTLPDEKKVKKSVQSLASNITEKMMETISNDVSYYCLCMNTWSLGRGDFVVLELILKYLTTEFDLGSLTLEIELTQGSFTRESIQAWLETSLHKWGLPLATLSALTGDHDESVISACKAMDIKHLGCISQSLRQIASVFLCDGSNDDVFLEIDDLLEKEEAIHDQHINVSELLHSELVTEIRSLIHEVRTIAKYVKSSDAARDKVNKFAKSLNMEVIPLYFDVRPHWNSVYDMISKFIKLKNPINIFLEHLKTPAGLSEFEWKDLPTLNDEKWAILEGLSILLGCFYQTKSLLQYDKHPTVVYALSILRRVNAILKDSNTFYDLYDGPLQKRIQEFKGIYGNQEFYPSVTQKMDCIRSTLSNLFERHFLAFDSSIIWISVLDPRLRKMKYLTEEEKKATRYTLIKEVAELKMESNAIHLKEEEEEMANLEDSDLFNPCDIFDSASTPVWKDHDEEEEVDGRDGPSSGDLSAAEKEVNNYLHDDALVSFKKDPLEWWKQHRFQFPQIATLAMKWLSVSAISTPLNNKDIKYYKHRSEASKDQLMIMKNSSYLNLTIEDIVKGLEN